MKFAGLVSLCTAIALSGLYLSYLHGKKLKILKSFISFFEELGELCGAGLWDFCICLKKLSGKQKYNDLTFIKSVISEYKNGDNLREVWENSVKHSSSFCMNSEVKGLLLSFSEVFGKSTRESFCARCSDYSLSFRRLLEKEEKLWEKNRDLTVYSGVLVAAAVFFIFI